MPPKGSKKSPLSAEQAKESGLSLMTRFFRHLLHKKPLHNLRAFSVVLYVKEKINRIPLRIAPRRRKNTHIINSIQSPSTVKRTGTKGGVRSLNLSLGFSLSLNRHHWLEQYIL